MNIFKHFAHFGAALLLLVASACSDDLPVRIDSSAKNDYSVSIEQAEADLMEILGAVDGSSRAAVRTIAKAYPVHTLGAQSRAVGDSLNLYVFDFTDEQGFAIMSADQRMPSLIALVDEGHYDADSIANTPGVNMFMDCTAGMLPTIPSNGPVKFKPVPDDRDEGSGGTSGSGGGSVSPTYGPWSTTTYQRLCPVKWGQNQPYNDLCPKEGVLNTKTGCVATAVAQLMACYKFPSSYGEYTFSWQDMTSTPTKSAIGETGAEDIARLMEQLGLTKNLDMNYGVFSSGSYRAFCPRTLKNFGYSNGGQLIRFTTNSVVNELVRGYPVLMAGNSSESGHVWLAHGAMKRERTVTIGSSTSMETEWYIQYNWGWDGTSDGYFYSGVFDTAKATYGDDGRTPDNKKTTIQFVKSIECIINIRK